MGRLLFGYKNKASIIINTSAYTNVGTEENEKAFLINSKALEIISSEALKKCNFNSFFHRFCF